MNKIVLITTEGCEGCNIMRRNIQSAVRHTSKEVEFKVVDQNDISSKIKRTIVLKDFPTTIFVKDENMVRKEVGTRPEIMVLRWIDIDFK